MPKVKPVISLFSQCINFICSYKIREVPVNADELSKSRTGNPRSIQQRTDSESDISSPLPQIPTVVLNAVIQSFSNHESYLTKTNMKHFNYEFLVTAEQKLIMPSWYHYNNDQFLNLCPKLEKLKVLVLQYSDIDNSCLKTIGTWCKNLRVLNVHDCNRLTDTGIEWLVLKPNELCKTLQELLVSCPAVTKRGIKMALQNCPALRIVENEHTFDVLVEEAQSAAQAQPHKSTSFAHLYIRPAGVYASGQLGSVVRYCPSLVDIYIEIKTGLTDTDLFCLTSLKNLHTLKFIRHQSGSNRKEITFDKGLAPVLKVIGNSLKVLYLVYFEFIDIWTVVKFCPNLMSLTFDNHCQSLSALSENEIIQLRHEKGRGYFQDLKILGCGFNLSNDILFGLLSCPLVENIYIAFCDALTDDLLREVVANGFLKNLQIVCLESCHLLTKQGLDALVMNDNLLKQIRFLFCEKVTKNNVHDWHEIAKNKNWELFINFKNFGIANITLDA